MIRLNGRTIKYIVYGMEIFLIYILQSTPSLFPAFFGELPMMLTVCAVSMAVFEGDVGGMWFGLAAGLMMDVGSTAPFGFYGLIHLMICFGCGTLVMYLMRNNIVTALILGLAAVVIVCTVQWIFLAGPGGHDVTFFVPHILLPRVAYSTAVMPLFFYFNRAIATRLYDE